MRVKNVKEKRIRLLEERRISYCSLQRIIEVAALYLREAVHNLVEINRKGKLASKLVHILAHPCTCFMAIVLHDSNKNI